MATKIAKTRIRRQKGFLYYLDKRGNVSRAPMARGGGKPGRGKPTMIAKVGVKRDGKIKAIRLQILADGGPTPA